MTLRDWGTSSIYYMAYKEYNVIFKKNTIFTPVFAFHYTNELPAQFSSMAILENGSTLQYMSAKGAYYPLHSSTSSSVERIMSDVLEEHEGTVSIAGRNITNLRFADDIDGLAGSEQELEQLVERIDQTSKAYGMEINAEKTKLMNINGIHKEIKASDHKLKTLTNFKYL